jgi:hypothetical protein
MNGSEGKGEGYDCYFMSYNFCRIYSAPHAMPTTTENPVWH